MARKTTPSGTGSALRVVEDIRVAIGEASAVVPLGGRTFLVADDEGGIVLVDATIGKGTSTVLLSADDDERVAGLEGMCVVGDQVLAIRERDGAMVSFAMPTTVNGTPRLKDMGILPRPPTSPGKKNKGWEGVAHLPGRLAFDKKDHIVACHEGKPRSLSLFSWPGLEPEFHHEIGGELDALLPDLSDVAVHPRTGEVWILSDESETVARVSVRASGLVLVASHAVAVEDGEKPEGIAFDDQGALWLVTDDSGRLLRLE